ncbi:MAG: hypothetical protein H8D49_01025 [Dehalococcoidia bacterium]|nr:hypothetical protein [Dehalococcoidia bacterium]MBL7125800.1 hypothetical protein [Dehalococcoidales bacterium]
MKPTASKLPRLAVPEPGLVLEQGLALELGQEQAQALAPGQVTVLGLVLELEPGLALVRHIRQLTSRPTRYQR